MRISLLILVVINIFPRFKGPDFRYTGAEPSHHVWNFGWPIGHIIYDENYGIQFSPWPFIVFVVSIEAILIFLVYCTFTHFYKKTPSPLPEKNITK